MKTRAAALIGLSMLQAACVTSRPPEKARLPTPKIERSCGLTEATVTREQALCIAWAAGVGLEDGTYSLEAGADLSREPTWVLREGCDRVPRCVELWIRQADGAIVNTRRLYAFEDYGRLPRRR